MNRKYVLKLTAGKRDWLEGMGPTGKSAAWKVRHANAFLKMDRGEQGPGWKDAHRRGLWHEHAQPGELTQAGGLSSAWTSVLAGWRGSASLTSNGQRRAIGGERESTGNCVPPMHG